MDMMEIKSSLHHGHGHVPPVEHSFIPPSEDDVEKMIQKQDRMCKKLQDKVLFDAIGSQFHLSIFVHQFLAHMFLPLFFLVPNTYGQGLRPNFNSIWFNIILPILLYLMLLTFLFMPANDKKLIGYSVWWPFFTYVIHRLMISLKYATLSLTEYKRFNECKDPQLSLMYLDQMMLFQGWLEFEPEVLFFELGAASARIGERINEIHMIIRNENHSEVARSQVQFWNAFLRGHREINECTNIAPEMRRIESGDYALSVYDIAVAVLRYCNNYHGFIVPGMRISQVFALLIIAVSYIPIFVHGTNFQSPVLVGLYMFSSTIINWVFGRLLFLFLTLVLYDVGRLKHMVKVLHCMIRISDVMMGISVSLKGEVSDMSQVYAQQRREAIIEINQVRSWKGSISMTRSGNKANAATASATERSSCGGVRAHRGSSRPHDYDPRASNVIGEKIATHGGEALIPRVTFEFPENILSWAYLRVAIQAFGERFRYRTDIYAGFTLAVMLILMVMSLAYLIMSTDRQAEFTHTYVLQSIIAVSVLVVFLLLISVAGAMVNEELALHSRTLSARGLRTRARLVFSEEQQRPSNNDNAENEVDNTELWNRQLECIDAVMDIVDVNNELRPFKFLGLTAQYGLTVSIFTAVLSFYSVLFSLYYSSNSAVSSDLSLA